MQVAARIAIVAATAIAAGLPGAVVGPQPAQPALYYLAGALGVGIVALVAGLLVLLAARKRSGGGLVPAVLVTAGIGLFSSWSVYYGAVR